MGREASGKTSMRSIIFANYMARETQRLGPTLDVEHSHIRFLGNLVLNLWDCGGQKAFMENYFVSQRDQIFRNVEVLIYVFDVGRMDENDLQNYSKCLEALAQNSQNARVCCLIHKMDLIDEDKRDATFANCEAELRERSKPLIPTCYQTSIWDESLYKAWSGLVCSLIPNISELESHLNNFCSVCEADEVVLFERATFLVISHATRQEQRDVHRFEKISNIIKQFKLSCGKAGTQFRSMETRNAVYAAYIEEFTANTYIMVVVSDPTVQAATTLMNVQAARKQFESVIQLT